jgi:outer membrane protein TolC
MHIKTLNVFLLQLGFWLFWGSAQRTMAQTPAPVMPSSSPIPPARGVTSGSVPSPAIPNPPVASPQVTPTPVAPPGPAATPVALPSEGRGVPVAQPAKPKANPIFSGRGGRPTVVSPLVVSPPVVSPPAVDSPVASPLGGSNPQIGQATPSPNPSLNPNPSPNLNQNPNPLELPSQLPQVQVNLNQPVTLLQVQQLAIRNSRTLQVSELQLQQQRAGLRQVQASLFPTVALQSGFSRSFRGGDLVPGRLNLQTQLQLQQQQIAQTQQQFQFQQSQEQQLLSQDLQTLQQRFQGAQLSSTSNDRNLELNQQLQQLQQSSSVVINTSPASVPRLSALNSPPLDLSGGGGGDGTSDTFSHTLSFNYQVYTGGTRSANLRSAKEQIRVAELEVQRQLEQLLLDVSLDYYNAQQADAQVGIAQSAVNNAQVSLRDAQAREQAGLGTRFDVLQAQVQLANATQNYNQARNLQRVSRRQLVQRLNLADTVEITPAEPITPAGSWTLSLPDSILLALKNRVELDQQLSQRQIAIQSRRIALSVLRPQVGFFANVNALDQISDQVTPRFGYSLGVQLRFDAFDGGAARAAAAEQSANIAQVEAQFSDLKSQIRLQVEEAYYSWQSNLQSLETSRLAVDQATEGLRLARLRFQAGVGTQADVTGAEADLTQARGNFLSTTLDYNRAIANLRRAVGYNLSQAGK